MIDKRQNMRYNLSIKVLSLEVHMEHIAQLQSLAARNGGIIATKTATDEGISRQVLAKLCIDGVLQRVARGQYIFADEMQDELLSIAKRSTNLIFSHETALFLHGISDRTPFEHSVTAPSNRVPSKAILRECKVYYIKPELFELGRTSLPTPAGNQVAVYDLERTICDAIRSRSKIGTETFLAALKAYAASPKKNLNRLNDYAKQLRISGVVRKHLEVLL